MEEAQAVLQEVRKCLNSIILESFDQETEALQGWTRLQQLEDDVKRVQELVAFEEILRELLNARVENVQIMPDLLEWFAKHLTEKANDPKPLSADIAVYLRNVRFRKMSELVAILEVLQKYEEVYLPTSTSHAKLCKAIVETLTTFPIISNCKQIGEMKEYSIRVEQFFESLCASVRNNEKENLMITCLKTLYEIISDPEQKREPGPALLVLQLIDYPTISKAVRYLLRESYSDQQLGQALKVLCSYLPKWPRDRLSTWVMEFINCCEAEKKYSILMDAAEETLPCILVCFLLPRQHNKHIIFYMLKRQGTPKLLRKISEKLTEYFKILLQQKPDFDLSCIQQFVDVIQALTLRFPNQLNFTELLNTSPVKARPHIVTEILKGPVWPDEENEVESQISCRSNCGKVGLTNLGNTCYMNSVLQALSMTRQFCHEVLNYKPPSEAEQQGLLSKLQNLFALLMYSKRNSWAPTEILHASRPAYFMPGQQQDSSEFLCHLLDVLYEQEKSINMQCNSGSTTISTDSKIKEEDSEITDGKECEPMDDPLPGIKRWTTEENLTEGVVLQRKTQSLADFTQGDDLSQTQNLSDSHSDSTDSGIQSVGGEDTGQTCLVHRVFGGETEITYQCAQCDTSSHNTDKFRDLQLCFPEEISENHEVSVQDLINYYLTPEKLTGDNKYRCDKCTKLCDAQRIIKILQAPSHLILTLKHFRYDSESRLRTKLRHKVTYNEMIMLPVCSPGGTINEAYHLYAAVVHSGYSMDYGHYFTYACDSKQNWYKFNDSYVSQTTLSDFTSLEPPDTPYILFYGKSSMEGIYEEDKPELTMLSKSVQDLIDHDTAKYIDELKQQTEKKRSRMNKFSFRDDNNHDDDNPPPSNCRGSMDIPYIHYLC